MADYPELKLLINGEWISRPGHPVINPADETSLGTVPHATTADLAAAVAAAEKGFSVWRRTSPGKRHTVLRQPIGPVAAFSPWNFPVSSPSRKVGGALSAGCSIILKASEETPGGAFQLARAFTDAGLPPGVLNLVYGDPAMISE